jgi:hypothetical protein
MDPHMRAILKEAHSLTWFVVEGADQIAVPAKGTGPGRPLADFIFAICYNTVLVRVKQEMIDKGLVTTVAAKPYGEISDEHSTVQLADCTFADDSAFMLINEDALLLIQESITLADIIHHAMSAVGFEPNYKPGKTAISYHFKGKNAKRAKQQISLDLCFKLPTGIPGVYIHIVSVYKHVGTMNPANLSAAPEVAKRCAGHAKSLGVINKYVFKKTDNLDPSITSSSALLILWPTPSCCTRLRHGHV